MLPPPIEVEPWLVEARLPILPTDEVRERPASMAEPVPGRVRPLDIEPLRTEPVERCNPEIPAREVLSRESLTLPVERRPLSKLRPSPATRPCGR